MWMRTHHYICRQPIILGRSLKRSSERMAPTEFLSKRAFSSAPFPEVPSFDSSEFNPDLQDGEGAFVPGDPGVGRDEMRRFWRAAGLTPVAAEHMARKAQLFGGVWGHPQTLAPRLNAICQLLPALEPEMLARLSPDLLRFRTQTVQHKIELLADQLPGADIVRMATAWPSILARADDKLIARCQELLHLLPRRDMHKVIEEAPKLLTSTIDEIRLRASELMKCYSELNLTTMKRTYVAKMLSYPGSRLKRLSHVTRYQPRARIYHTPMELMYFMKERAFDERFKPRRHRYLSARKERVPKTIRKLIHAEELVGVRDAFQYGEQKLREWQAEVAAEPPMLPPPPTRDPRLNTKGEFSRRTRERERTHQKKVWKELKTTYRGHRDAVAPPQK